MADGPLAPNERLEVARRAILRTVILVAGALALYLVVFEALDPPSTYSCEGDPPPEAVDARAEFLPPALVLTALAAAALGALAWRWAAARMTARGREPRPGRLALAMSAAATLAWAYPFVDVFGDDDTGGAVFYSLLLGLLGLGILGVLALGLLLHLTIVKPIGERWKHHSDSLTTAAAWSVLQFGLPAFAVMVGARGTDTTVFC